MGCCGGSAPARPETRDVAVQTLVQLSDELQLPAAVQARVDAELGAAAASAVVVQQPKPQADIAPASAGTLKQKELVPPVTATPAGTGNGDESGRASATYDKYAFQEEAAYMNTEDATGSPPRPAKAPPADAPAADAAGEAQTFVKKKDLTEQERAFVPAFQKQKDKTLSAKPDTYDNLDFSGDEKVQTVNEAPRQPAFPSTWDSMNKKPDTDPDDDLNEWGTWALQRGTIDMQQVIGQGQYGEVWGGLLRGTGENEGLVARVAVKILKSNDATASKETLTEARVMQQLHHHNILRLYGVCIEGLPILIVTEFMHHGNLRDLIRSSLGSKLRIPMMLSMAIDVVTGMGYMEHIGYVHRDLSCRNIVVDDDLVCKVSDFGMTKRIGDSGEYNAEAGHHFPVRWTAPEGFSFYRYSHKSDVWSFGVLLFELVTYGKQPYAGMTNTEVMQAVRDVGYRLGQPAGCPAELHEVMLQCWATLPDNRPEFTGVHDALQQVKKALDV